MLKDKESYYILVQKQGDSYKYKIYDFALALDLTDELLARSMAYEMATLVDDESSKSGQVIMQSRGVGGWMVNGPWMNLKSGKYDIEYYMKFDNIDDQADEVFAIEATADNSDVLSKSEYKVSDFESRKYQKFVLSFEAKEDLEGVEYTISSNGVTDIYLDYIKVNKIQ